MKKEKLKIKKMAVIKAGAVLVIIWIFLYITSGIWTAWGGEYGSVESGRQTDVESHDKTCAEKITVTSETVYDKNELEKPEQEKTGEDGSVYELETWNIEETKEKARTEYVKETVTFYGLGNSNEANEVWKISLTDSRTGRNVTAEGRKTESCPKKEWWMEEAKIPLVCYLCKSKREFPAGESVVYNENQPPQESCREILEEMGISEEDYQIDKIVWEGNVFTNEEGDLCRMVRTEGKRRVRDYEVTYEGTVVFPEVSVYRCRAVYALEKQEKETEDRSENSQEETAQPEAGQRVKNMEKSGEGEESKNSERKGIIWSFLPVLGRGKEKALWLIRETDEITISAGMILLAVLLWRATAFARRNKKK